MKVRWLACATAVVAAACTSLPGPPAANPDAAAIEALAPGGKLRVGLYPGSPTNFIPATDGAEPRGIAYELAKELASRAHVSFDPVVFSSAIFEATRAYAEARSRVALGLSLFSAGALRRYHV